VNTSVLNAFLESLKKVFDSTGVADFILRTINTRVVLNSVCESFPDDLKAMSNAKDLCTKNGDTVRSGPCQVSTIFV
jgi:hypothetical protein